MPVREFTISASVTYNGMIPERMLTDSQCEHFSRKIETTINESMGNLAYKLDGYAKLNVVVK